MSKSILCDEEDQKCFICGKRGVVNIHHIMSGVSNRKNSEEDGLKIYLCPNCHADIHDRGKVFISKWQYITESDIKAFGQRKWEETYGTREEFIKRYGKSWIMED